MSFCQHLIGMHVDLCRNNNRYPFVVTLETLDLGFANDASSIYATIHNRLSTRSGFVALFNVPGSVLHIILCQQSLHGISPHNGSLDACFHLGVPQLFCKFVCIGNCLLHIETTFHLMGWRPLLSIMSSIYYPIDNKLQKKIVRKLEFGTLYN